MKPVTVETKRSSFILQLVFNSVEKHLTIIMKGGKRYRYYGVSKIKFTKFCNAPSKGSYYSTKIKAQYPVRKLKPVTV